MLRINLIPSYIAEQKKVNTAIALASLLFLAVLGGGLFYYFGVLLPKVAKREEEASDMERQAQAVTAYATETQNIRAKVQPLKDKVDFVEAVRFHNIVRQQIYRNAARYTYRNVEYTGMQVGGNTLQINAFVRNLSDLGRFYITMFGNPDVTAVSFQGIPSWPQVNAAQGGATGFSPFGGGQSPTQAGWFPVQLTASLVRPVITPTLPASVMGGGTAGGFRGGMPGGFGAPGGPMGSGPGPGGFSSYGGGAGAGGGVPSARGADEDEYDR